MLGRGLRRTLITAFAAVACVAAALPVTTGTALAAPITGSGAGLAWTTPAHTATDMSGYASVSCVSPTFCMAVDVDGGVRIFNGSSWGARTALDPGRVLLTVSCASSTFCVVGDDAGGAFTYNAGTWSAFTMSTTGAVTSISCTSSTFCVSVESDGRAHRYTGGSWDGWSPIAASLDSVSCVSTTFCLTTAAGGVASSQSRAYNGTTWLSPVSLGDSGSEWTSVSCATATFCAAANDSGQLTMYNGTSWSAPQRIDNYIGISSVSCSSTVFCVAVDLYGQAMMYDGTEWSHPADVVGDFAEFMSLDCVVESFCVAVDTAGYATTFKKQFSANSGEMDSLGQAGQYFNGALAAAGGTKPYTWSALSALPSGLSLSSGGNVFGTPTEPGFQTFNVKVTDATANTATATIVVYIFAAPYESINPTRLFDTRSGAGGVPKATVGAHKTVKVKVAGKAGVPANATAVALNVTAVSATAPTFVTVYPAGTARPQASTLNPSSGAAVANFAIVRIGAGGYIDVYNDAGSVEVLADVQGYYPAGSGYVGLTPSRSFDTRTAAGGVPKAKVGAHKTVKVKVTGRNGVPADADSVALNVTAVGATKPTFVTVYPAGEARPNASTLNPGSGAAVANFVIVRVGAGGYINVYNDAGNVDVLADVQGYFTTDAAYVGLTPKRLFDTRSGAGGVPHAKIGAHGAIKVKVRGAAGVPSYATAVALNITVVGATKPTFVTAYPHGATRPLASNANPSGPAATANFALVRIGSDGYITIYNDAGSVEVLADVQGYVAY